MYEVWPIKLRVSGLIYTASSATPELVVSHFVETVHICVRSRISFGANMPKRFREFELLN